jgi:hypothetical protein
LGRLIEMTVKHSGLHRAMSSQLAKTGDTTLPGLATIEERFGDLARIETPFMATWAFVRPNLQSQPYSSRRS